MTAHATVTLAHHGLELRCAAAGLSEDRKLTEADAAQLQRWAEHHQTLARAGKPAITEYLDMGRELHAWLNGSSSFLTRLLNTAPVPLLIEFAVSKADDSPHARALLDAPWELLAEDTGHWALDPAKVFCPVRRIGQAVSPPPPGKHRLGVVFMAAAPRGADNLDFEAEEASILQATRELGLDLAVEESGTLNLLAASIAREQPDVVQISCHGALKPEPGLLLEDDVGDPYFARTSALISKLAAQHRRLLFLSACETAEAHPILDSLARGLVRSGAPGVLGWAAPVLDREATQFAASLYARLVQAEDLAHACAYARLDLFEALHQTPGGCRDWHLARLYLASAGGGVLATAGGPQRHLGSGQAVKSFLDAKGKQVPVAGPLEFVGRRREIQGILRECRAAHEARHAGVFIHGVGRQGKSSLAARVAQRLEATHETVVIYGRYDAPYILRQLGERLAGPEVSDLLKRHLSSVEQDQGNLLPALTELLKGPCAQLTRDEKGRVVTQPVLLVVDDFEQALDAQDRRTLRPEYFESIRALLLAFRAAKTQSRLLFTSRYQFTCLHDGQDLADSDHLLHVPLHGMNEREARKQAQAKLRLPDIARSVAKLDLKRRDDLEARIERIVTNARGNPGLQDLLFTLAVQNSAACDRCLVQMEEFLRKGTLPAEDAVRKFLENLALGALTGLLTPAQRELLLATTLFELPVPVTVFQALAGAKGGPAWNDNDLARLLALGLLEVYEDLHQPQTAALALNALVRPLAGRLNEASKPPSLVRLPASCSISGEVRLATGGAVGFRTTNSCGWAWLPATRGCLPDVARAPYGFWIASSGTSRRLLGRRLSSRSWTRRMYLPLWTYCARRLNAVSRWVKCKRPTPSSTGPCSCLGKAERPTLRTMPRP